MEKIFLRPYQQQFIDDVNNEFKQDHKRVVGVAPCGSGKTIMTGWIIRESVERGLRSIFFVHRQELIRQTSETFDCLGIPHGIICAGVKEQLDLPVQIASVQTLAKRLKKVPAPDFLICDECHHILAETYKRILNAYPEAYLLGVTATPQRMGGITLHDVFTSMVKGPTVDELIKLGNLTDFNYYAPATKIDLKSVKVKFGEYVNSDLAKVMEDNHIIGSIVDNYKKFADGKSAICYCVNVRHSMKVCDSFLDAGISAAHVDGVTPAVNRERIVEDFRLGKIKVLCNAELFSEGFDVPNMQAVILARPTKSLTLFIQQALRPMRPDPNDPNKVAIILDHVQNYLRHGLPNMNHNWSLNPNPPKGNFAAPLKECPECNLVVPFGTHVCPECGYEFVTEEDKEARLEEYNGVLIHVKKEIAPPVKPPTKKQRVTHAPTTPEDFMKIAKEKDYKVGWVAIKALEHAKSYEDCVHIAQVCGYKKGWAYYRWQELEEKLAEKRSYSRRSSTNRSSARRSTSERFL